MKISVAMFCVTTAVLALDAFPALAVAPCPPTAKRCFEIQRYSASTGDASADARWWQAQLQLANAAFKPAGIAFVTTDRGALAKRHHVITDARHRDRLGRRGGGHTTKRRSIAVFSPLRLLDVPDKTRDRHGVHWRDRGDRRSEDWRRRWLIVVNAADRPQWSLPIVLAHELGHFFGLPHGKDPTSLMNKSPNDRPPMAQWRFTTAELDTITRRSRQMLKRGRLRDLRRHQ